MNKNIPQNVREASELYRMDNEHKLIEELKAELKATVMQGLPLIIPIDILKQGYRVISEWLTEKLTELNSTASDEEGKYHALYDMRQAGSFVASYKGEDVYHGRVSDRWYSWYNESIIDKYHALQAVIYYRTHDIPIDYNPRDGVVVPVSACESDDYWTYENASGEETDTDDIE